METLHNFKELQEKVMLGTSITGAEASALTEHLSIQMAMKRPAFDFAEIEGKLNCGRLEELALMEQNRRFEKNGPRRPGPAPFPYDHSPAYTGPYLASGKGGHERMMDKFRAKLAEIRETGVVE
ncbi:MAG: hypothetical protein NTV58_06685 [Deltaproteobacteria bacterium]|nr:hypothetical protein [Deltaproteobacteria bacterium]